MEKVTHVSRGVFWLTYAVIISATIAFISMSFHTTLRIISSIEEPKEGQTETYLDQVTIDQSIEEELILWSSLELDTLNYRQNRANSLLMSRTWLRFMTSAFGLILISSGAIFVLSRVQASQTSLQVKGGVQFLLTTSSPGLVMVTIGAVMSIASLVARQDIKIRDGMSYMPPYAPETEIRQAIDNEFNDSDIREYCTKKTEAGDELPEPCEIFKETQ